MTIFDFFCKLSSLRDLDLISQQQKSHRLNLRRGPGYFASGSGRSWKCTT